MSKLDLSKGYYTLYYVIDGEGRKSVGLYTDKELMIRNIETCLQELINQIDTKLHTYEIEHCVDAIMLVVNSPQGVYIHSFEWEEEVFEDVNIIEVERVGLARDLEWWDW